MNEKLTGLLRADLLNEGILEEIDVDGEKIIVNHGQYEGIVTNVSVLTKNVYCLAMDKGSLMVDLSTGYVLCKLEDGTWKVSGGQT